jgi:hypothetical protein
VIRSQSGKIDNKLISRHSSDVSMDVEKELVAVATKQGLSSVF